jgi:hypothetical protein
MATTAERLGIVETKVVNLDEKLDDIKNDVQVNHQDIKAQLKTMYEASCTQHGEMASKIKDLEGFKMKWTYMGLGSLAVLGWVTGHIDAIAAFLK